MQHGRGVGEREEHLGAQLEGEVHVAARVAAPGGRGTARGGGAALVVAWSALARVELQLAHAHDHAGPQPRPLAQPAHPVDLDAQHVGQLERLEVMDADAAERRAHLALGERAHEAVDVELAWAQG